MRKDFSAVVALLSGMTAFKTRREAQYQSNDATVFQNYRWYLLRRICRRAPTFRISRALRHLCSR